MALISDRDVFNAVVGEWLTMKDVVNLDSAFVAKEERVVFLELLSAAPYKPPFAQDLEKWWRNHKDCLRWLMSRRMLYPSDDDRNMWHVNHKLWNVLLDAGIYNELIPTWKGIFFEGFAGDFNMQGLDICQQLKKLQLCNLSSPQPAPGPICPSLNELILQNSKICDVIINNFLSCPQLKKLELRHVNYSSLSEGSIGEMLNHLEQVKVLNNVAEFINNGCKNPNRIQVAHFDMLHTTGSTEFDRDLLERFFKNSPHLRELHIERMCVDIAALFSMISKYCSNLSFLHLNHVRPAGSLTSDIYFDVPFTHLKISTLLPSTDDKLESIVNLTKGKINFLHLSFSDKLTDAGYLKIRDLLPHLHFLQVEDKKEVLDGVEERAGRVQRLTEYFANVPNIRINLWPAWVADKDKGRKAHEMTVAYIKGF